MSMTLLFLGGLKVLLIRLTEPIDRNSNIETDTLLSRIIPDLSQAKLST